MVSQGNDTISEVLRRAIRESGASLIALERLTGVERMSISRFLDGRTSLRLDCAEVLAAYFGLALRPTGQPEGRNQIRRRDMFEKILQAEKAMLHADHAFTFTDEEERRLKKQGFVALYENWTAWQKRLWPADEVKVGLKAYVFNKRCRALVALYRVVDVAIFPFASMPEFVETMGVRMRRKPSPADGKDSERKWKQAEKGLSRSSTGSCLAFAYKAEFLKVLDPCLELPGWFPMVGWCRLRDGNFGMRQIPKKPQGELKG
jgi:hypothetical protein